MIFQKQNVFVVVFFASVEMKKKQSVIMLAVEMVDRQMTKNHKQTPHGLFHNFSPFDYDS